MIAFRASYRDQFRLVAAENAERARTAVTAYAAIYQGYRLRAEDVIVTRWAAHDRWAGRQDGRAVKAIEVEAA